MAGGGTGEHAAAAYWYDACEDGASLLCAIDFAASADFDPGLIPAMDSVAEIDRILESINAESSPAPPPPPPPLPEPVPVAPLELPIQDKQLQVASAPVANNAVAVMDVVQKSNGMVEARKEPRRESHGCAANGGGGGGGEWRDGKRPRLTSGSAGGPRQVWRRRPMLPPPPSRGWDDRRGRRDFDRVRKRDRDEHHRREARGFWERDRGGTMVFRPGTWEQESDREAKRARTQDGGSMEKKAEADRMGATQREKPVADTS